MRPHLLALVAASAIVAVPAVARADQRKFPFTYEALTLPKGGAEIEQYLTTRAMRLGASDFVLDWHYQLEVEYGITDRLDISIYQMFSRPADGKVDWQGYKAKVRWRPVDYTAWPIDPLLYLEFIQLADGSIGFEEKIVLGKRTEHFSAAVNLTVEEMGLNRAEREIEFAPSIAAGYTPKPWFTVGGEALMEVAWKFAPEGTDLGGPAVYVGPSIAFAGSRAWAALSNLWQVGSAAHDVFRFRILLGVTL